MNTLRIHCAGDWYVLSDVREALEAKEDVQLVVAQHADVVLLASENGPLTRATLENVRAATPAPVLLVALDPAEALLDAAESLGVDDVVPLPQPLAGILFAARKAARAAHPSVLPASARRPARVLTVFSPKGGTGKSVTSCNLAYAAASHGLRTLLLDLDLQFGDTAIMLGLEPRKTLFDVVEDSGTLDAEKLAGYVTQSAAGVDVLPAPLRPEDAERVSEARISHLIDVARHVYDVIVVDTSPYFHAPMLATLDRTDRLVLVAAPDVPTLKNLRLTLHTLQQLGFDHERMSIVLNRADPRAGLKPAQVAAVLAHRIDYYLPADPTVPATVNRGVPAVKAQKRSPWARAFAPVAAQLLEIDAAPEPARARRQFKLAFGWR